MIIIIISATIGFQCLTIIRCVEQGIWWVCADPWGGGGAGGPYHPGKSQVIWVDLDLNPLPPLTKFPGSAHGGGGGQFISLECTDKSRQQTLTERRTT